MKPIHLYIKTHKITGKKYFGKTVTDPFSYRGSGKEWLQHLKEYGNEVRTEILGVFEDRELAKSVARKFSTDNDIVRSDAWLNLIPETLGGWNMDGKKSRDSLLAKYGSGYYRDIAIKSRQNRSAVSEVTKEKIRSHPNQKIGGRSCIGLIRPKVTCPHCGKNGANNTMSRWHFDNCRSKD